MKLLQENSKGNRKLSILGVLFFCVSLGLNAQSTNDLKVGSMTFETDVIDYGQIVENDNGERIFKFTNTGDAPLIISKVKTSCGCTVPTYPETAILPGQAGEIKVSYDTKRVGPFTKSITVFNNGDEPTKSLKIKGEILKKSI